MLSSNLHLELQRAESKWRSPYGTGSTPKDKMVQDLRRFGYQSSGWMDMYELTFSNSTYHADHEPVAQVYIPEHHYKGRLIPAENVPHQKSKALNKARIERLWGALDSDAFQNTYTPISSWGRKYQKLMMAKTLNHANCYDLYRYLVFNKMPPNLALELIFAGDAKRFGNFYRLYPSNQYTQHQVTNTVHNVLGITTKGELFTTDTDMYDNSSAKIVKVRPSVQDRERGGLGYTYVWNRPQVYKWIVPGIPDLDIEAHNIYEVADINMRPKYPHQKLALYKELGIKIPWAKLISQTEYDNLPPNERSRLYYDFVKESKGQTTFGVIYNSKGDIIG